MEEVKVILKMKGDFDLYFVYFFFKFIYFRLYLILLFSYYNISYIIYTNMD